MGIYHVNLFGNVHQKGDSITYDENTIVIFLFEHNTSLRATSKLITSSQNDSGKGPSLWEDSLSGVGDSQQYFSQPKKETGLAMILPWNSKLDTWHGNLSVTTQLSRRCLTRIIQPYVTEHNNTKVTGSYGDNVCVIFIGCQHCVDIVTTTYCSLPNFLFFNY